MNATGIEKLVCEDIARRQELGTAKYGTTVADNPLPLVEWLRHAYFESLDFSVYLRKAIDEQERAVAIVSELLAASWPHDLMEIRRQASECESEEYASAHLNPYCTESYCFDAVTRHLLALKDAREWLAQQKGGK